MKILWLTWKDLRHPLAGGAERVSGELAKRLAREGNEVLLLTAGFPGGAPMETMDGYRVVRLGNRWTVYGLAWRFYRQNLRGWADVVVDEVNTVPFFAKFYVREHNLLFFHQLCREIWFYEMFFPLNFIGYLLEPVWLRLLGGRDIVTVSRSTATDLARHGLPARRIRLISEGTDLAPAEDPANLQKFDRTTLLSFGSIRAMKRTLHLIRAFELAKAHRLDLRLVLAGDYDNEYGRKVFARARCSPFATDIVFAGKVSCDEKRELMRRSHLLLSASVKEGWGLVVTEAASQGTPAIVYDADGLRDSVQDGLTGVVCRRNTPLAMSAELLRLLDDPPRYEKMRRAAWSASQAVSFDRGFASFKQVLEDQLR